MAGLGPAIYVFADTGTFVGDRAKPGHDSLENTGWSEPVSWPDLGRPSTSLMIQGHSWVTGPSPVMAP